MIPASLKALLAAGLVAFAAGASAQKTQLTVYTALETDQIKAYEAGFSKTNPNIELKWVRDSTGVITAKLLAEKANPQADVVHGRRRVQPGAARLRTACSSPTRRSTSTRSCRAYRDKKHPPAWVGHGRVGRDGLLQHGRGAEEGNPEARDLEGPDQAGLQGPDRDAEPGLVGHRLLRRHRMAAAVGRPRRAAAGSTWTRCTRTSRSTRTRARSPAAMAAAGEFVVGISFEYRANSKKAKGAPIDLVFPKEGLGWDLEGVRHHEEDEEARRGEEARRLGVEQGRDAALRARTSRSSR